MRTLIAGAILMALANPAAAQTMLSSGQVHFITSPQTTCVIFAETNRLLSIADAECDEIDQRLGLPKGKSFNNLLEAC